MRKVRVSNASGNFNLIELGRKIIASAHVLSFIKL